MFTLCWGILNRVYSILMQKLDLFVGTKYTLFFHIFVFLMNLRRNFGYKSDVMVFLFIGIPLVPTADPDK